jgi:hypothetical protein
MAKMPKYPHEKLYAARMRPHELKEAAKGQPEGFSTPGNISKWAARASDAHSGPRFAPGTGPSDYKQHQRE